MDLRAGKPHPSLPSPAAKRFVPVSTAAAGRPLRGS